MTCCSCARFESNGIRCRHVLVLLRSCHVNEMPNHYLKMCHKATRSEDAFLFVAERLQRYESDLNEYLSASLSLGCGMSSVRSAKYADTIAIYPLKMSEAKGSARWIKGGKELAIER